MTDGCCSSKYGRKTFDAHQSETSVLKFLCGIKLARVVDIKITQAKSPFGRKVFLKEMRKVFSVLLLIFRSIGVWENFNNLYEDRGVMFPQHLLQSYKTSNSCLNNVETPKVCSVFL